MTDDHSRTHDVIFAGRTLGICWLVYGILELATAALLVLFGNIATLMFGALLNRVPDPFTMMDAFHFLYALLVAGGIAGVAAGVTLLSGSRSARFLTILAALLSLWRMPIGTTLGIYSLIVLPPAPEARAGATRSGAQVAALGSHVIPT